MCVGHEYTSLVRAVPPLLWQKRSTFCSTSPGLPTASWKKRNSRLDQSNSKQLHALPMAKVLYLYVGHGKVNHNCFDNSETDVDSMTCVTDSTNVTARDVCV